MAFIKCSGGAEFDFSKLRVKMKNTSWYWGYPNSGSNGILYGVPTVVESFAGTVGTITKGSSKLYSDTDFKKIIYTAITFTWTNPYRYGFTCFKDTWERSWYYGKGNSMGDKTTCDVEYVSDNSFNIKCAVSASSNPTATVYLLIGYIE